MTMVLMMHIFIQMRNHKRKKKQLLLQFHQACKEHKHISSTTLIKLLGIMPDLHVLGVKTLPKSKLLAFTVIRLNKSQDQKKLVLSGDVSLYEFQILHFL
eukprot:9367683-Ditylum_brightwellii.AAC.1